MVALPELCRRVRIRPKDAYEPGGKAAAELKGAVPAAEEILDLALAAAFTSMSLRDRCRDPAVDADLVLTVEALEVVLPVGLLLAESGRLRLSWELEDERSDCGSDTTLSELFRWVCRAFW